MRLDLIKLRITEKLAHMASFLIIMILFSVLFLFFLMFISLAFIYWFRDNCGAAWVGSLIVAGTYLFIGFISYLLRYKLFINPVVTELSKIMMEEEDDEKI